VQDKCILTAEMVMGFTVMGVLDAYLTHQCAMVMKAAMMELMSRTVVSLTLCDTNSI